MRTIVLIHMMKEQTFNNIKKKVSSSLHKFVESLEEVSIEFVGEVVGRISRQDCPTNETE